MFAFGQYAFKLGYDFTNVTAASAVAAADFGFSGDLLVNTIQPTKIGMGQCAKGERWRYFHPQGCIEG